jgi:DNA/RNA-binding domain of Phe-tRNA-synthetase-like protein
MILNFDSELQTRFPSLIAITLQINDVKIQKRDDKLEKVKLDVMKQVRDKYDLNALKDQPTFRVYRDFFWRIGLDPTKIRPATEALIRRILAGKGIPRINTLVDSYNLASIRSKIPLATFDSDELEGPLLMTFAKEGESFYGIGMEKPLILKGGEIVVSDEEKLIAVYPYRDAENTKVIEKTKNVTIIICGVPGVSKGTLSDASLVVLKYVTGFCGGVNQI